MRHLPLLFCILALTAAASSTTITDLTISGEASLTNVVDHAPVFVWSYDQSGGFVQTAYEIDVGSDDDWSSAELWDPFVIYNPGASSTYEGDTLTDGTTYFVRVRISDGTVWSDWSQISFRMNSKPKTPLLLRPTQRQVTGSQPTLWVLNSFDADGDEVVYDFFVSFDSICSCQLVGNALSVSEGVDSTGWQVSMILPEDVLLYWHASARDGYERSEWAPAQAFWVNGIESPPASFELLYPPDTNWSQVYEVPVEFLWQETYDPDPLDSVFYRLLVSEDESFDKPDIYDSIYNYSFDLALPNYGTHYWWKVYAVDLDGDMTQSAGVGDFMTWIRGDANADYSINVGDGVSLVNYVFKGGEAPQPLKIGDINGDCEVNVGDAVYVIAYIFKGGPSPATGCAQ